MTAPEPGHLSEEAAEADVLEQRASALPADDAYGTSETGGLHGYGDVLTLEANPADVAEQQQVVPVDWDERDDSL